MSINTDSVASNCNVLSYDAVKASKPNVKLTISPTDTKEEKNHKTQILIEEAILDYQSALAHGNSNEITKAYAAVCAIYPPLNFVRDWFVKYHHLYDTREDFIQEYLMIFCESLSKWKPRSSRPQSKWNGSGEWKNYFWSSLKNAYSNKVKREAAAMRNLSCRCPICATWCNPLSTHILTQHDHLLWEQMMSFGIDVNVLIDCPFCKSHKVPRVHSCEHSQDVACAECKKDIQQSSLRKHLLDRHSTYLFERFRNLYPDYNTLTPRPISVYMENDDKEEDQNMYDNISGGNSLEDLMAMKLSETQRRMINRVISDGARSLSYDSRLYNCTLEEYQTELESLQDLMSLCGMSGTNEEYDDYD